MSEPYIGEIKLVGWNFAARGWALCDGQLLPIASNTALFSLLGTTFGGDGRTTFALPDLRGRAARHVGRGPGLNNVAWGQRGGAENHVLTVSQMPSHNHIATLKAVDDDGGSNVPEGKALASAPAGTNIYAADIPEKAMATGSVAVANNGGGQQYSILNPYLGIYHIIALQGVFPSRN